MNPPDPPPSYAVSSDPGRPGRPGGDKTAHVIYRVTPDRNRTHEVLASFSHEPGVECDLCALEMIRRPSSWPADAFAVAGGGGVGGNSAGAYSVVTGHAATCGGNGGGAGSSPAPGAPGR